MVDLVGDLVVWLYGAGAKFRALEAFWGFSSECLILDPCASKCIHRLWLLGSQVYGPFRNAGVVDKSVSHWDLDPSGYWQTVAVKKLELIIGFI